MSKSPGPAMISKLDTDKSKGGGHKSTTESRLSNRQSEFPGSEETDEFERSEK